MAPEEILIHCLHDRRFHVVEDDLNRRFLRVTDDPNGVPLVIPRGPWGRFGTYFCAVGPIHDKDLVRMVVHFLTKVDVIKLGGVLITKKQACVTVAVIRVRRLDIDVELEGFQLEIIDE